MPRPKSKDELIELSQKNYSKLMELVNSYSEEDMKVAFSKGTLNRNIKESWHIYTNGT